MKRAILILISLVLGSQVPVMANDFIRPTWYKIHHGSYQTVDRDGNLFISVSNESNEQSFIKRSYKGVIQWKTKLSDDIATLLIVPDDSGGAYLCGGSANESPAPALSVHRLGGRGKLLWKRTFAVPEYRLLWQGDAVTDSNGGLYLVASFGHYDLDGWRQVYQLMKYSSDGELKWVLPVFNTSIQADYNPHKLIPRPGGGVTLVTSTAITTWSNEGAELWSSTGFEDSLFHSPNSIRLPVSSARHIGGYDASTNFYVAGLVNVLTPTPTYNTPHVSSFPSVQKRSPNGQLVWTAEYRGPERFTTFPNARVDLLVDPAGSVYLGCSTVISCVTNLGSERLPDYLCDYRPTLIKFSPSSAVEWVSRFAINDNIHASFINLDLNPTGECLVSAVYANTAKPYDPETWIEAKHGVFLGRCDPLGNQTWGGQFQFMRRELSISLNTAVFDAGGGISTSGFVFEPDGDDVGIMQTRFKSSHQRGAPTIEQPPVNQRVTAGENATLTVQASGRGRLRYQWRFNSRDIPGANQPSLQIQNFGASAAGDYSVEVRSVLGRTVSTEARIELAP